MSTKEELILENELLRKKLALAEAWMRKEVLSQKNHIARDGVKSTKRKQLDNILERESVSIITQRIQSYFGESLRDAPKFTLNHLIDAEIYWQTLQKFPLLDALPVVSSYQKILESFFEKVIVRFRQYSQTKRIQHFSHSFSGSSKIQDSFDRDIENVLKRKYSLSLGRWYYFFEKIREGSEFGGDFEDLFLEFMTLEAEGFLETCISEPFFSEFSILISLEVFGKKRHENKVSYADAEKVRTACIGPRKEHSLLFILMKDSFS